MILYKEELKKQARPFETRQDFAPLIESLKNKKIVMLGEASHGTHEFYEWRARITQELIENHGFHFVAVEGDWPPCEKLNRFIHHEDSENAYQALSHFTRWPTWMWANAEVARFASWMRKQNSSVGFHGLDVYSLFESIEQVIQQLQKVDAGLAKRARTQYACFDPYLHNEKAYARSLFSFPEGCKDEVLDILQNTLKKKMSAAPKADAVLFDAIQNARIVKNAEKYYRTMIEADDSSWNVRDRHMLETLEALQAHYGKDSKAIVWAHNTHVGDYRATDMKKMGQVNLGGLAREKYGEEAVALVGFGTYRGNVIASHAWDGPTQILTVPSARAGSVEAECHEVALENDCPQFFILFNEQTRDGPLSETRGHRAIGVVYDPRQESWGNYVPTSLSQRYDAFIYLDETHALRPIQVSFDHAKIPENWPATT